MFSLNVYCFFHLLERQRKTENREKEGGAEGGDRERSSILHLLGYSPNAHNSQEWTKVQPGTRISIHVSLVNGRGPST